MGSSLTTRPPDADAEREDEMQYGSVGMTTDELQEKSAKRPKRAPRVIFYQY